MVSQSQREDMSWGEEDSPAYKPYTQNQEPANNAICSVPATTIAAASLGKTVSSTITPATMPMADVGLGFTMQISPNHRYKLYTEARYEDLFENSNLAPYKNVEIIPLTVGILW